MNAVIENQESKRHAIVKAATQLFLTHTYRGVSMEKIAQSAPVSKATLYNHFDSKHDLFAAVIRQLCNGLLQTMTQTLSTRDDVAKNLEKIATAFVELLYSADGLAIYRLVIAEAHEFPQLGQMVYDNGAKLAIEQLTHYLQQLHDNQQFNISNPYFAADAFFSLLKGDLHFRCLLGIQTIPTSVEKTHLIHAATDFYLRGILHAKN